MTNASPKNGSISPNKIVWFIITVLLGTSMMFARTLSKNIRYEINSISVEAADNSKENAKQEVEIMGIREDVREIKSDLDTIEGMTREIYRFTVGK